MNEYDDNQLPPELASIGDRLRASRPVAADRTLDRAMRQNRQGGSRFKPASLIWASKPPQLGGRAKLACATLAGSLALAGASTGGAMAAGIPGFGGFGLPSFGSTFGTGFLPSAPTTATAVCPAGSLTVAVLPNVFICVPLR